MSARAGGSASKLPLFRELWPLINRGLYRSVAGTPLRFYLVEASWIRGRVRSDGTFVQIYQDFCLGGNSEAYAWMQPDTVIVEKCLSPLERRNTAVHEFEELITMAKRKKPYETAHSDFANPKEKLVREHPERFEAIWTELCAEYRQFLQATGGYADRVGLRAERRETKVRPGTTKRGEDSAKVWWRRRPAKSRRCSSYHSIRAICILSIAT